MISTKKYFCRTCSKEVGPNAADNHAADGHHVNRQGERVLPKVKKKICPCHPPEGVARTCSLHVYLCADESCDCNCDR
jgi:hypothetical protein